MTVATSIMTGGIVAGAMTGVASATAGAEAAACAGAGDGFAGTDVEGRIPAAGTGQQTIKFFRSPTRGPAYANGGRWGGVSRFRRGTSFHRGAPSVRTTADPIDTYVDDEDDTDFLSAATTRAMHAENVFTGRTNNFRAPTSHISEADVFRAAASPTRNPTYANGPAVGRAPAQHIDIKTLDDIGIQIFGDGSTARPPDLTPIIELARAEPEAFKERHIALLAERSNCGGGDDDAILAMMTLGIRRSDLARPVVDAFYARGTDLHRTHLKDTGAIREICKHHPGIFDRGDAQNLMDTGNNLMVSSLLTLVQERPDLFLFADIGRIFEKATSSMGLTNLEMTRKTLAMAFPQWRGSIIEEVARRFAREDSDCNRIRNYDLIPMVREYPEAVTPQAMQIIFGHLYLIGRSQLEEVFMPLLESRPELDRAGTMRDTISRRIRS